MKRIFIAFAIEDARSRDFLVGQAKGQHSPFEFVDMSVKEPWASDWQTKCRTKMKGCDGVIALISKYTPLASGQLFEIKTAEEEGIPIMYMYSGADRPNLPYPLNMKRVNVWTWPNIKAFIDKL